MARQANGVWRLHRSLIGVDGSTRNYAKYRVKLMQPDEHGHFEFYAANRRRNSLGKPVFDMLVRYVQDDEGEP